MTCPANRQDRAGRRSVSESQGGSPDYTAPFPLTSGEQVLGTCRYLGRITGDKATPEQPHGLTTTNRILVIPMRLLYKQTVSKNSIRSVYCITLTRQGSLSGRKKVIGDDRKQEGKEKRIPLPHQELSSTVATLFFSPHHVVE